MRRDRRCIKFARAMDVRFSEEQNLLRESARAFLERECPMSLVREVMEDPTGSAEGLWKKMAEKLFWT